MKKRERGTARETGGRILYKAKKTNKTIAPAKTFITSVRVCESSVSSTAHTHTKTHGQSVPPPAHYTAQNKTSFVS